jgi:hypothetical protein
VTAFAKRRAGRKDEGDNWGDAEVARTVNGHDAQRTDGGGMLVGVPEVAATLKASGRDGGRTADVEATHVPVLDTYNQAQVDGGVTNTLSTSPTTAVASADAGEPCTLEEPCSRCRELDPPPDGFRYAACGDGVAAPVAHWIGLRLLAAIEEER